VVSLFYYLNSDCEARIHELKHDCYYLDQDDKMATEPVTLTPDQDGALQYPGLVE
jgi:phage terminase large subunit